LPHFCGECDPTAANKKNISKNSSFCGPAGKKFSPAAVVAAEPLHYTPYAIPYFLLPKSCGGGASAENGGRNGQISEICHIVV
jgi:hypothetical protein